MFILDTIKPVKRGNTLLVTPKPIRIISLVFTSIGYLLLYLNIIQNSQTADAYSFLILIFILANMYFLLFHKVLRQSNDKQKIILNYCFLGIIIKQVLFPISEIENVFFEDRRMGQTISQKYRLFIRYNGKDYNLGVVNHINKAEFVKELILKKIKSN